MIGRRVLLTRTLLVGLCLVSAVVSTQDPLPSWNDRKAKQSIIEFVAKVTKEGSPHFVPPGERIATFDNDRTSTIGRLDKALDEAQAKGWTVVKRKTDWKRLFVFEK